MNFMAIPGKQEITITRILETNRETAFQSYTDPTLIPQWWGPSYLTTTIDKMVVRPGGIWRFIQHDEVGNEFAFHGVYHTVQPPEKIVYTFEFEGMPGHVMLETITFEDQNGQTLMTDLAVFQSVEDRDEMLSVGMEAGATETMDRFAELVVKVGKILIPVGS